MPAIAFGQNVGKSFVAHIRALPDAQGGPAAAPIPAIEQAAQCFAVFLVAVEGGVTFIQEQRWMFLVGVPNQHGGCHSAGSLRFLNGHCEQFEQSRLAGSPRCGIRRKIRRALRGIEDIRVDNPEPTVIACSRIMTT